MLLKIILTALFVSLFSCSLTPYKVTLTQGSKITQKLYDNLEIGMAKQDVINLLGSPSINSVYSPNRFDYVHMYKQADQYFISSYYLVFEDNLLITISEKQVKDIDVEQYSNYNITK